MSVDESQLGDLGFKLCSANAVRDSGEVTQHRCDGAAIVTVKIRPNARAEILGFTNVYQLPISIIEPVNSGGRGNFFYLIRKIIRDVHIWDWIRDLPRAADPVA